VSLLAYLAVLTAGIAAVVASRRRPDVLRVVAALSLAASLVAAFALSPGAEVTLGESRLVVTPYARAWLIGAGGAFLFLHLLGMLTVWQRNVPLVMLAVLGATAAALTSVDPVAAFLGAAAGAMIAVLGALLVPVVMPAVRVAVDAFRVAAVGAGVAVLAVGWVEAGGPSRAPEPLAAGFALMALALSLRLGVFPFHTVAARLTQSAPLVAVPILIAWVPSLFGALALAWQETRVAPLAFEPGAAASVVVAVALITIAATGVAGALQDDAAQLMAYSTVQDAAFVVLALGSSAEMWPVVRGWLILFVLAKTAAFGLVLALSAAFHTRATSELTGWARRSPPLLLALFAIAVASYGWPGLLPFDVRERLLRDAVGWLTPVGLVVSLLPLAGMARLAIVGLQRPGPTVRRGFGSRPVAVPFARPARAVREHAPETPWARAAQLLTDLGREIRHAFVYLRVGWRLNRAPAAAVLVVVLALLPLALAVGRSDLGALGAGVSPLGLDEAPPAP
jgi:NADH:ubiquinone oxidoreductase subunit 2 (subunit N)